VTDGPILVAKDLGRRFDGREVIGGLTVRLQSGQRIALWGPNGSGKTTILRCVAGSITPTSGTAHIDGHPAGSFEARRRTGTSFSQERSFYFRLTGRRNLVFFARLRGYGLAEAERHVSAIEEELELERITSQRVDRCSSGMIQQLAFGRALLGSPGLLLLDEPTRSLDEQATGRLWAALHRRPRSAVLIATHRREDLEQCDSHVELPLEGSDQGQLPSG
jgi:ABC-type multidrug transport system ATPase subunit